MPFIKIDERPDVVTRRLHRSPPFLPHQTAPLNESCQDDALIGDLGGPSIAQGHDRAGPAVGVLQRLEIHLAPDSGLDPGMAAVVRGEALDSNACAERADARQGCGKLNNEIQVRDHPFCRADFGTHFSI